MNSTFWDYTTNNEELTNWLSVGIQLFVTNIHYTLYSLLS